MAELEVVKYIKEHGLDDLCNRYSITAKRHGKYPNLVLLKYDQINSPFVVEVVRQCRGIILDEANDWKVVCFSYRKFANWGEGYADKIDLSTSRVLEKLDGSLCQLYFYDGDWHIATSGMPDADGEVNDYGKTFDQLFREVWEELDYELPTHQDEHKCFAFELMTPYNRIVVRHPKNRIVLHGARDLQTLKELNPVVEAHYNNWECVKSFSLTSWDEIVSTADALDPMSGEGFVVVDANFNRVKVKGKQYVALSHLKESVGASKRQLLEVVRRNEGAEFLSYFQEYANDYYEIKSKYDRLLGQMEGFLAATNHITDRKTFAQLATQQNYSDALFKIKYGKASDFKAWMADIPIKTLEQLLGMKE